MRGVRTRTLDLRTLVDLGSERAERAHGGGGGGWEVRDATVHFGAKNQKRNSGANGGGEARRVKQRASSLAGGYDETAVQVAGRSASAGHCEVRWHLTVSVFLANCRRRGDPKG